MFDLDKFQEIWHTITHNKSRSVMTAFGVFWGMFMLVVMVGLGLAFQKGMNKEIEGFATNSCFIWNEPTTEPFKGFRKGRFWSMENEDVFLIKNNIPEIQNIAPVIFGGTKTVNRNDKTGSYNLKGTLPAYNDIDHQNLVFGRFINDMDVADERKVCVLGERVYEVMFPGKENPLGKTVQVSGIYFRVVGVTRSTANVNIGGRSEETVLLPFSTMQKAFNINNTVHFLAVTAKPGVKVKVIEEKARTLLKNKHQISPDDKTAVGGMNIEEMFTMFYYLGLGIASLIWIVGLGTLLAGAIGVSNIMLVTVRERTREIGIRRALGAAPATIIRQILAESIVLTLIAGLIGLLFGVLVLSGVGMALAQSDGLLKDPQITFTVALSALFILVFIGTLAGLIPANRAIKIKAIEAIREE